MLHTKW